MQACHEIDNLFRGNDSNSTLYCHCPVAFQRAEHSSYQVWPKFTVFGEIPPDFANNATGLATTGALQGVVVSVKFYRGIRKHNNDVIMMSFFIETCIFCETEDK